MYHAPSHYQLLSHTTMPIRDKPAIDESHLMIIFKQNFILFINKNLLDVNMNFLKNDHGCERNFTG